MTDGTERKAEEGFDAAKRLREQEDAEAGKPLETFTDLCRELWKHEEVREAWGEWRDGDKYVADGLVYTIREGSIYIKKGIPIFPLSDPEQPARGLLGMIKQHMGWGNCSRGMESAMRRVTFEMGRKRIGTPDLVAATLLLEILEGKDG